MCSVPPLPIIKPCWCISLRIGCLLLGIAQVLGGASNILFYVSGERILVDIQLPLGKYEVHIFVHLLELITSIIVCTVGILGIFASLFKNLLLIRIQMETLWKLNLMMSLAIVCMTFAIPLADCSFFLLFCFVLSILVFNICGAIIIGFMQFVLGAVDLQLQLYGQMIMIDIETPLSSVREHKFYQKTYVFEFAASIIASFLGLILLIGAAIKIPSLINIYRWTFWSLNVLFLISIAIAACFIPLIGVLLFLVFLVNAYLLVCVNSFYLQLIDEKIVDESNNVLPPVIENNSNIDVDL